MDKIEEELKRLKVVSELLVSLGYINVEIDIEVGTFKTKISIEAEKPNK